MMFKLSIGTISRPSGALPANIRMEDNVLSQNDKGKPAAKRGRKTVNLKGFNHLARLSGYRKRCIVQGSLAVAGQSGSGLCGPSALDNRGVNRRLPLWWLNTVLPGLAWNSSLLELGYDPKLVALNHVRFGRENLH